MDMLDIWKITRRRFLQLMMPLPGRESSVEKMLGAAELSDADIAEARKVFARNAKTIFDLGYQLDLEDYFFNPSSTVIGAALEQSPAALWSKGLDLLAPLQDLQASPAYLQVHKTLMAQYDRYYDAQIQGYVNATRKIDRKKITDDEDIRHYDLLHNMATEAQQRWDAGETLGFSAWKKYWITHDKKINAETALRELWKKYVSPNQDMGSWIKENSPEIAVEKNKIMTTLRLITYKPRAYFLTYAQTFSFRSPEGRDYLDLTPEEYTKLFVARVRAANPQAISNQEEGDILEMTRKFFKSKTVPYTEREQLLKGLFPQEARLMRDASMLEELRARQRRHPREL